MSYEYIVDSYAWIEYFQGSEKGAIVKGFIEKKNCATSALTIAEISEKYHREGLSFEEDFSFIMSSSKIIAIDADIAMLAGKVNYENKKKIKDWGMADSIILATARMHNAKVITGDAHFKEFSPVMI